MCIFKLSNEQEGDAHAFHFRWRWWWALIVSQIYSKRATSESETKPFSHDEDQPEALLFLWFQITKKLHLKIREWLQIHTCKCDLRSYLDQIFGSVSVSSRTKPRVVWRISRPGFTIQWVGRAFSVCTIYQRRNIFYSAVIRATAYCYSSFNVNRLPVSTAFQTVLTCLVSGFCATLCAAAPGKVHPSSHLFFCY